ncbi:LON peptidase substrate-binding domain-containing protein [Algibacillus agarilyticus]|uniref:LON peptidase substrate-binding domain-containing protein n=1 Tax=Algibacillus agarilyticus TaxID=2234133 RepID=UPI000DD0D319|nr:LON peptidase substrate-binding domain-containing protein [Algibacillus agarilyticus]
MNSHLPIFPLNIFILPGGVTRLRIFEQRYIRMVSETINNTGFVISQPITNLNSIFGCLVKIIDFDQEPDGLLMITVEGLNLVEISNISYESDGLAKADIDKINTITVANQYQNTKLLGDKLIEIFNENSVLTQLYPCPLFDDPQWVCSRWLELLPFKLHEKIQIIKSNTPNELVQTLHSVIIDN